MRDNVENCSKSRGHLSAKSYFSKKSPHLSKKLLTTREGSVIVTKRLFEAAPIRRVERKVSSKSAKKVLDNENRLW